MKWFLDLGSEYARKSDWKDFALVKFCLCAIGILLGLCVPARQKKAAAKCAFVVFLVTYIPLMIKTLHIAAYMSAPTADAEEKDG